MTNFVIRNGNGNGSLYLNDLLKIFRKRWKFMIAILLAVCLPATAVSMFKPVYHTATVKILLENSRRVNLEMSTHMSERVFVNVIPAERLNSQIEILKGRELLGKVVRTLGLANTQDAEAGEVTRLQRQIEARLIPASTIIEVSYSDKNAAVATRVVNTLADLYQKYHLSAIEGDDALAFYETQFNVVDKKLKEDYIKLNDLRNRMGILYDFAEEQRVIQGRITALNLGLSTNDSKINELQAKLTTLSAMLSKQSKEIKASVDVIPNPDAVAMKAQLNTLEMETAGLLMKYTKDSREVRDNEDEIALLKSRLAQLPPVVEGKNILTINSNYQSMEKDLVATRTDLEGMKQSRSGILAELKANQLKLAVLNSHAYEFRTLEQAVDVNHKNYRFYLDKRYDAQFMDAVNRQGITSVNIVEGATATLPQGSPMTVSFGLALALGAALALGVAFMLEWFRPTLGSAEQVRDALTLPVLATISERRR
jgi:uncharacterized protein involved in exopolysaccharide biosynthesis